MRDFLTMVIVGFALSCLIFAGCEKKGPTEEEFEYPEATISHWGFDFSKGDTSSSYTTYDGETITWQPGGGTHPDYPKWRYLWWRNSHLDAVNYKNQTKDMGEVDIPSVTNIPAEWDTTPLIPPLLIGHTIVAKCRDGYVKFQVLSTDTTAGWPAQVKYYYSVSPVFED